MIQQKKKVIKLVKKLDKTSLKLKHIIVLTFITH
jgi:hypothetical protein